MTKARDRLNDPDEHFPYKHEHVCALIEENGPAGPDGPDDDRLRVQDYISQDIADATKAYVEAQAAWLSDPGDATQELHQQAARDLVEARRAHRANRPAGPVVVGIRARRSGE